MIEDVPPTDSDQLRARAAKCRAFAREYASDVGSTLNELAVELDKKADRLDRKDRAPRPAADPEL